MIDIDDKVILLGPVEHDIKKTETLLEDNFLSSLIPDISKITVVPSYKLFTVIDLFMDNTVEYLLLEDSRNKVVAIPNKKFIHKIEI